MMEWPSGVLHALQDEGLEDSPCPTHGDTTASLAFSMRRRRSVPPSPRLARMSLVLVAAAWQTPGARSRRGQLRDWGALLSLSPVPCPLSRVGAEGGRWQLLEGSGSQFPSRGRKERVGHVLQAPLNSSRVEEQRGHPGHPSSSPGTCQVGTEQQDMSPGGCQVLPTSIMSPSS